MIPTWTTGFHSDYSTINLTKIRLKLRDFELKVLNLRGCSPLRQQWDTSKSPLQTCNLTWKHYRYTLRHSNAQTAIFLEKTSLLCTISSQTDLTFTQQTNFHNIRIWTYHNQKYFSSKHSWSKFTQIYSKLTNQISFRNRVFFIFFDTDFLKNYETDL